MPINVTWDHIHLRTPDPEAMAAWLRDILGGEIVRNPGRIDVKLGGASVFIAPVTPGDGVHAPPVTPYQGLDHFGLTVKDIDAVAAEIKAKGVESPRNRPRYGRASASASSAGHRASRSNCSNGTRNTPEPAGRRHISFCPARPQGPHCGPGVVLPPFLGGRIEPHAAFWDGQPDALTPICDFGITIRTGSLGGRRHRDSMKNGLYSIHVTLQDGRSGKGSGVVVFQDGKILGGDAYLFYTGSYRVKGDTFKGEVLIQRHTPSPDINPLFGGPEPVGVGVSGTFTEDAAVMNGTALVGKASQIFSASLRFLSSGD